MSVDIDHPRTALLVAIADDELVTGHRHSHWTGVAPGLEEDLAFSTIAQDEINHADVWYQVVVAADGDGGQADRAAVDALALGREPGGYRHAVLCERPPTDFVFTLARQFLYDHFDALRLGLLAESRDPDVAAVARKLLHEERYHVEHADLWVRRLTGTEDGRERMTDGFRRVFDEALWLFEPTAGADGLVATGLLAAPITSLLPRWLEVVAAIGGDAVADALPDPFTDDPATWTLDPGFFAGEGGRHGRHTPDFTDDVWQEMTYLHRSFPGASW